MSNNTVSLTTHKRIRQQMAEKKAEALEDVRAADGLQEDGGELGIPDLDLSKMKVPELRELAEQNGIDLAGLSRKDDIVDRILKSKSQTDANASLDEDADAGEGNPEAEAGEHPPIDSEVSQGEPDSAIASGSANPGSD